MKIHHEPQDGYWHATDRQMALSNKKDRQAARETNAAFLLVNVVPFGTPTTSKDSAA